MTNKLDASGLNQVLQSVDRRMAHEATSVFKTDSTWEAASFSVLQGWVTSGVATDTINNRTVNNYDVYAVHSPKKQYYFDSGDWFLFTADLTDYYTKSEGDSRYPTIADFSDINLAVSPVVIPSKLAGIRQILETHLTGSIYGLITAVQATTVSVQFTVGTHTGTATLPFDGAMATAKVGGLVRVDRQWNRTVQETTVTYTLDTVASRCYSQEQQQADWNITDPASPGYIHHKPTIPAGVSIVDHLNSTAGNESLAANQGRVLKEMIAAKSDEPLSTADINSVLVAAGFPAIIGE